MTKAAPGPRGGLILGNTLDFRDRPLHFVEYVARAYGDVTRFRVGGAWWYLLAHPDHIHDAMTTRAHLFLKPAIARRLWAPFLGDGLLTAEGPTWKHLHRLVLPAFHHRRIAAYGEVMVDYTHRMLDAWTAGERRDLSVDMVALTLEIVAKTLFDADVRHGAPTVGRAMQVLQDAMIAHIHNPIPVPRWWPSATNRRKLGAIADVEGIVRAVIDARRSSGEDRGDLLSMLLLAQDDGGARLSDTEVRDQAMTLFFAGHETTAHAMTWAWYLLARHPEVVARVRADLDRVVGGQRLTVAHLAELPYLDQVVKESLRVLTSVWVFMKQPTEDVEVGGYQIPKGSPVMISPYVVHRDARWFPSPETFDPDRWSPERARNIPNGAFIPFSGGARICLGKSFAMMEARLVLATMLQRLDPVVPEDYVPRLKAQLSMHPDGGLPVEVRPRGGRSDALVA